MISQSDAEFRKLIPLLRPHLRKLLWGALFMVIYVSCWPVLAWQAGLLIPAIGEGNLLTVIKIIFGALFVFFIQKLSQFAQDTLLADPALRISQDLRIKVFKKLQKIQLGAIEKLSTGDITYRLTEDADRVGEVIYKTIQDTTPSILQLVAVFIYMVFIDWQLSIATLLLAPLVTILVSQFGARVMFAAERSQKQVSELAALLGEAIQGLPIIRAFAAEEWLQNRFDNEVELHRRARYKTLKLLALQHPVVGFIEATGILAVLVIGAARIQSGGLDGQGFSSYVAALLMLIDPISHLTTNFNELKQGQASLSRLRSIQLEPEEAKDILTPINLNDAKGEISLRDVCFSYDNKINVLNNININIKKGQVVALVGPSGSGKSTLLSLLLRFIRPKSGEIFFDGYEVSQIKSKELRQQIALVPQRTNLFSGSISDVIKFGRTASKDQVINASRIANAHDFIMSMPDGYQSQVEEGGTNLSGGQLQRIAIARAVLGNPSVLLLDEATSALDADSEAAVQLALSQAMKDRTVLVIAHRLSTVQEADQIIVIDNGSISDCGTHDELITREGRYKELCQKQFIRNSKSE